MTTEAFDAEGFIQTLLAQGWRWSGTDRGLLVHPADHDFAVRYDAPAGRLTLSPQLDEHLKHVIATPPSKGRFWR